MATCLCTLKRLRSADAVYHVQRWTTLVHGRGWAKSMECNDLGILTTIDDLPGYIPTMGIGVDIHFSILLKYS